MNENEYGTPDFSITTESTHPVLTALKKQIEDLTAERDAQRSRANELSSNFANYKYKLENVLTTLAEDNSNLTAVLTIADEFDIDLKNTKDFEVTATFRISVTVPFGEEIELSEYDFSASLESWEHDFEVQDSGIDRIDEI